ncbi:sigma-70 family RNA polymerase sigma factor [Fodinicurvata sp. EGI_FJ10296]|uniref:sigma-70 family RNA polymerase sigma factor n=1 Tax=Fodinicurvata sp. EGI_FJ10296 TaxID=3231908 RepID=UPI0034566823
MPDKNQRRRIFKAEVERLMDRLYGTALRLTRNPSQAEDLVAETLGKAWAGMAGLQDTQCFEKWVFRIMTNTFISERRRQRDVSFSEVTDTDDDGDEPSSLFDRLHQPFLLWWGNPEQQLLDKLLREDIEHALDSLPDSFRLVVIMVEIQGASYAEAADTLGVPVGTVRSRLKRGRARLQAALWRQAAQRGICGGSPPTG